jgi:hypothetical protein
LSLSASPAFAPWGMPFFVELVPPPAPEEPVDEEVLLVAAAPEDPDDPDADEAVEEEFEPQAATARATSTSASGARRRIDVRVCVLMGCAPSSLRPLGLPYARFGACCSTE